MRATPNILASCFAGKICFLRHEALGVGSDDLLEPFLDVIVDEGEKSTHGPPSDDARLLEIEALPHEGFEMEGLPHGEPIGKQSDELNCQGYMTSREGDRQSGE